MPDQYLLPGDFNCDDPPRPPLDLQSMLFYLRHNRWLRKFIRDQIQKANSDGPEAEAAQACLASWYMPSSDELADMGLPAGPLACTEHSHLVATVANNF
jgi:hypothetical protein